MMTYRVRLTSLEDITLSKIFMSTREQSCVEMVICRSG